MLIILSSLITKEITQQMPDQIVLPQRYYLANFKKLCEHANTQYADLLNEQEAAWIKSFDTLDIESQCLLVRLLTRKGAGFVQTNWFIRKFLTFKSR